MPISTRKITLGLAVSLLAISLSACANPTLIKVGLDTWCDTNHPQRPTKAQYATYSHDQKVDMADHNTAGQKWCGWKP